MTGNQSNLSITIDSGGWQEKVTFWIEGVLTPIVSFAGIVGKYHILIHCILNVYNNICIAS